MNDYYCGSCKTLIAKQNFVLEIHTNEFSDLIPIFVLLRDSYNLIEGDLKIEKKIQIMINCSYKNLKCKKCFKNMGKIYFSFTNPDIMLSRLIIIKNSNLKFYK